MTTASPFDKETRAIEMRTQAETCLRICQLEMQNAAPDFDYAYDFADKALRSIGTLRTMTIGGRAWA